MLEMDILHNPNVFAQILYERMKAIHPGVEDLALYEFHFALDNLVPANGGWANVQLESREDIEKRVNSADFYASIQLKPRLGEKIVLDENICRLTIMLMVGLVTGVYPVEWVKAHFYFDLRGFFFLHRTVYFSDPVLAHFDDKPYRQFEQKQKRFERLQSVGYKDFASANAKLDRFFIQSVMKLIAAKGIPLLLAIAGPTAAGKTEIVSQLQAVFAQAGQKVTTIEMDHFLTDRDEREAKGIDSLGRQALHFALFRRSLDDILQGRRIAIPRYDFINATSSHNLDGSLKSGCTLLEIEPADIIFIEGNFPFLYQEVAQLIGIKVVYLTDDAVRLQRKWLRDIDYRKKYDATYFRNRYFKDQFLMAQECYLPQMEGCDMVVDTTGAALWATAEIAEILSQG